MNVCYTEGRQHIRGSMYSKVVASVNKKKHYQARSKEQGVALIEFAISIPVVLVMIMAVIETGRALNQYMILTQIAYEGARIGAQLAGMSPACFESDEVTNLPWKENVTPEYTAHKLAQERSALLFARYEAMGDITIVGTNSDGTPTSHPRVSSQFIRSQNETTGYENCNSSSITSQNQNTFGIEIAGNYQPKFFPVITLPFKVRSQGSFLSNNNMFIIRGEAPTESPMLGMPKSDLSPVGGGSLEATAE